MSSLLLKDEAPDESGDTGESGLQDREYNTLEKSVLDVYLEPRPAHHDGSLLKRIRDASISTDDVLALSCSEFNDRIGGEKLSKERYVELQISIRRRRLRMRLDLRGYARNVIFTAPHTLSLCRDGHPYHRTEVHTKYLAIMFGECASGASLTWSDEEIARINTEYRTNPPETNRDPNYLLDRELAHSPWFHALRSFRTLCRVSGHSSPTSRSLHCDIHGMADASVNGIDCVFGTKAMEQQHGQHRAMKFREKLSHYVGATFAAYPRTFEYTMSTPSRQVVRTLTGSGTEGMWTCSVDSPVFSGAQVSGRNTMCEMTSDAALWNSVEEKPFAFSVQIELSRSLRDLLRHPDNRNLCDRFVKAILKSASFHDL